jgi:uncharacterized repeat protein (TIGR01451 family)
MGQPVGNGTLDGQGSAGACERVVWNVKCLSAGDVTFDVVITGVDSATQTQMDALPGKVDVAQVALVTTIVDPAGGNRTVSVGQHYTIEATVENCSGATINNVLASITLPFGVELDGTDVVVVVKNQQGGTEKTYTFNAASSVNIEKICPCCTAHVYWHVKCTWASCPTEPQQCGVIDGRQCQGEIVTVTAQHVNDQDSDSVTIIQECKAHLMAGMSAFAGSFSGGSFVTSRASTIAAGQHFTVVVPVTNVGEADAEDVSVTLSFVGNATLTGSLTRVIGDIPGRSTRKAIYEFECNGAGEVAFNIASLSGTDVNWNQAIEPSNIEFTCTYIIQQVTATWRVEIINPVEGITIDVCTDFVVKAKIWNDGNEPLNKVSVTLDLTPKPAQASLYIPGDSLTRTIDKIMPGWKEVLWNLHCLGNSPPRMDITVTATAAGFTGSQSDQTYVYQYQPPPPPPTPGIDVHIDSPGWSTAVYTGETFLVTAWVNETNGVTAEDVSLVLDTSIGTVVGDEEWYVGTLTPYQNSTTHTWQVREDKGVGGERRCQSGEDSIYVYGYIDGGPPYDSNYVSVDVMPAARLVVENLTFTDMNDNPITSNMTQVCSEFKVKADVVNYGWADAWNVMATLSVTPDGSVRPAAGEAGYTKPVETAGDLGNNLVGWGEDGVGTVEWIVHCKQACESTITITPSGQDECGWQAQSPEFDGKKTENGFAWVKLPGDAVQARNIVPASLTIKQLEQGVDLAITKKANTISAAEEQMVTFTVVVTNNGPKDASGVVVTDTWTTGAFATPVVTLMTQGSDPVFDDGFTWNVGSLVKGASATLKYTVVTDTVDEIVNTAEVNCAEGDGILENNQAVVKLNVSEFTITLKYGWNLISLPLIPTDGNITVVMGNVGDPANVYVVGYYDASNPANPWQVWAPDSGWSSNLEKMEPGKGYWVLMLDDDELTVYGSALNPGEPPPSTDVFVGWNLIGFKSLSPKAANVYLNGITGLWSMMLGYSSGYYQVEGADMMNPGSGYWLAVPGSTPGTRVGTIFSGF